MRTVKTSGVTRTRLFLLPLLIAAIMGSFLSGTAVAVVNGGGHTVVAGSSATYGDTVVWTESPFSNQIVHYKVLPSGPDTHIANTSNSQTSPAIYGSYVIWREAGDLFWWDLERDVPGTSAPHQLTANSTISKGAPQIFGDRVVWAQTNSGLDQIYTKRLGDSGNGTPLAADAANNQSNPVIYGDYVVWTESPYGGVGFNLKAKNITTGTTGSLCTATEDQVAPAIYGTVAVWVDKRDIVDRNPDPLVTENGPVQQIYYYDLAAGLPGAPATAGTRLSATTTDQTKPTVSGQNIAWLETRRYAGNDETDIYLKPIGGAETRVTTNGLTYDHNNPSLHQNLIYEEQMFPAGAFNWDIMQGTGPSPGALSSVTVTPADATLKTGESQSFYAQGHDANFNPVAAAFNWTATGGSVNPASGDATVYTAGGTFGDFSITASSGGFEDSSPITIMPTPLDHVTITAGPDTVQAGGTATYSAQGYDDENNPIPGLTYTWQASVGSIEPTGASVLYTAATGTGPCQISVEATSGATKTDSKGITIIPGALNHLDITPGSATVLRGASLGFSVQGQDIYHNNITGLTYNWSAVNGSVDPGTGSSTTYTAPGSGNSDTVTVSSGAAEANAAITLTYLDHIHLTPVFFTLQAGTSQSVSAVGHDNLENVINGLSFDWTATGGTVNPASGASTTYTADSTVGTGFSVTATYGAVHADAPVTIDPGPLDHLHITPESAAVGAGEMQSFSAQGEDFYGNPISGLTYDWTATGGNVSPGTGPSTIFTAQTTPGTGFYVRVASGGALPVEAAVTVNPGPLDHIDVTPASVIVSYGKTKVFSAQGQDLYHNNITGLTYGWSAISGSVDPATGASTTYTAPAIGTSDTLTVVSGTKSTPVTITLGKLDDIKIFYDYGNANTSVMTMVNDNAAYTYPGTNWNSGAGNWDSARSRPMIAADENILIFYDYGNSNSGIKKMTKTGATYTDPSPIWTSGPGNWDATRSRPMLDSEGNIIIFYDYGNSNSAIFKMTKTGETYTTPALVWISGPGNWESARSRPMLASNNDIIIFYDYGNANSAIMKMTKVGETYTVPALVWISGPGNWESARSRPMLTSLGDVIIFYDYGNENSAIMKMTKVGETYTIPALVWISGPGNWDSARSRPMLGDYNGDTLDDVIIFYDYGNANSAVMTMRNTGLTFDLPRINWISGPGNWEASRSLVMIR